MKLILIICFAVFLVVLAGIAWFILGVIVRLQRTRGRVRIIQERLRPLSNEQLTEIMRTPKHPDSQFALVELMKRGVDARPTKEQLFGMLTSGNPKLCGDAIANLQIFYPEVVIPEGASNLDTVEVWQSRVEVLRQVG
ncbi:MAG TPA: hypothetical protein VKV04_12575 [Verrucomicrobiae bacterium]|nr:hypothetical protein [Verrucomicrobiae bacterium]